MNMRKQLWAGVRKCPSGPIGPIALWGQDPGEMRTESEVPISAWDSGILTSSNWQLVLTLPGPIQASRLQVHLPSEMDKDSTAYDVYEGDPLSKAQRT